MRCVLALCSLALFAIGASAADPYPHKSHVAFLDGSRVLDAADLSELSGWKIRYCLIEDSADGHYKTDREIDLANLWLNGVKYDAKGRLPGMDVSAEIMAWYSLTGACRVEARDGGGLNLITLTGDELAAHCKWAAVEVDDKRILANAYGRKLRTLEECRAIWRKANVKLEPFDPRQMPVIPPAANQPKFPPGPPTRQPRAIPVPQCPKVWD